MSNKNSSSRIRSTRLKFGWSSGWAWGGQSSWGGQGSRGGLLWSFNDFLVDLLWLRLLLQDVTGWKSKVLQSGPRGPKDAQKGCHTKSHYIDHRMPYEMADLEGPTPSPSVSGEGGLGEEIFDAPPGEHFNYQLQPASFSKVSSIEYHTIPLNTMQ